MSETGILPWQSDSAIVPAEAVDDMHAMRHMWNSVPLIRCRDCEEIGSICTERGEASSEFAWYCFRTQGEVTPDGFCAWAVRRS